MSMNSKRIAQWVVVLGAVALIVFAYFRLSQPPVAAGNALSTIPSSSSLIIEIEGFAASGDELQLLKTLLEKSETTTCFTVWRGMLQQLDSLRASNRSWFELLEKTSLAIQTADVYSPNNWSVAIGLSANSDAGELMKAWLPDLPKRDFKGTSMYVGSAMNWCVLNNCIVLAPAIAVLEDLVIKTGNNEVITTAESFRVAYDLRSKDIPLHFVVRINEQAWLPLEPVFTKDGTLLNGYLAGNGAFNHDLQLTPSPGEWNIASVLPANTLFLDVLHTVNGDSAWHTLNHYYDQTEASSSWSKAWQDLSDSCQCDLNEAMLSWRTGEVGCAVIDIADSLAAPIAFIGVSDTLRAIDFIQPFLAAQADPVDEIYTLANPIAFQRNLPASASVEPNYVMQLRGYLFAATTPAPLRILRNAAAQLSAEAAFITALNHANPSSGRFIYQTTPEIAMLPSALMALIQGTGSWSITTEANQGQLLVSIGLPVKVKEAPAVQAPPKEEKPQEISEEKEVEVAEGQTWQVVNHNTQAIETLRHDGKNSLELVGADGKVLWTIDVQGPILGKVVQVDALKNNKLQMAFATESAVYIIDRNGSPLPGFPYYTKPPITSPLLVADYDNSKKYRLIFSAGDGMLFNLGVDGKATAGWKYRTTGEEKIVQVVTAKIGGDDVIITASQAGKLQLLKRTGETKAACNSVLEGFDGKTFEIIPGSDFNSTSAVYSSGSGVKNLQLSAQ